MIPAEVCARAAHEVSVVYGRAIGAEVTVWNDLTSPQHYGAIGAAQRIIDGHAVEPADRGSALFNAVVRAVAEALR